MNNITLAHIGAELVVIGGVALYFHRKTAALRKDITALQQENKELREAVENLADQLQRLGQLVMQQQQPRMMVPPQQTQTQQPMSMPMPPQSRPVETHHHRSKPKKQPKKPVRSDEDEDSGAETYDDRDLDLELDKEYSQLAKERKKECVGETCSLVD